MAKVVEWDAQGIKGIGRIVEEEEAMPSRPRDSLNHISDTYKYFPAVEETTLLRELANFCYALMPSEDMSKAVQRLENAKKHFEGPVYMLRNFSSKYHKRINETKEKQ